ncbi:SDR family oxidoreductase [Bacteriovoracaceae bacterium]|nr:SDR family oxidoreductase [Bacteriovoracaceae bacterium]
MTKRLENKVAVITGGNSGIGLATAKLYKDEGAKVIITARSDDSYQNAIAEYGKVFDVVKTDITNLNELENLYTHVKDKYGKIDILFANAGIAYFAPMESVTEDFFDSQFNTNVKGLFFSVQKAQNLLAEGASVILNTSGVNTKGLHSSSVYAATKAAVRSLARTLSAELVAKGIRVNALAPGPVETPIYSKMGMSEEEVSGFAKSIKETTPIGRFGSADELAKAALFLASDDSSFVLGTELVVDGGFSQL